jgi:hypothetical protein
LINQIAFRKADFEVLPGSNTFRVGTKYKELVPGQTIEAVDADTSEVMGSLVVAGVNILHLRDALMLFEEDNHGVREAVAKGIKNVTLRGLLAGVYPDADLTNNALVVTVVEFAP